MLPSPFPPPNLFTLVFVWIRVVNHRVTSDSTRKLFIFLFFFYFFIFLNFIIYLFIYLFIYLIFGCVGSSFLCEGFLSCSERGPLFIAVRVPLTIAACLVAEHRLQTRRLSSCGLRA